jgi:hypothetical protein
LFSREQRPQAQSAPKLVVKYVLCRFGKVNPSNKEIC